MNGKIYIAVSGCKNGFSVLYTSPGLDRGMTGLSQTLDDMRAYLRVSRTGIDYYGLSFLKGYRVCSQYRSTVDSAGSSGGFIGVSLFIPDDVQIASTRLLLNRLFDAYYREHYNERFGTPIPGCRENGATLEGILQACAADCRVWPVHYKSGTSEFGTAPLYIGCASEAQVDAVFASPYQKAYLEGSKVIILPSVILAQPQAYSVSFTTTPRLTSAPATPGSDRMTGRLCSIVQKGCVMSRLTLNGTDYTATYPTICLLPSDRIAFTVTLPDGRQKSFEGPVHQALAERLILTKENLYGFNFFPYEVAVALRGATEGAARANIFIPAVATEKETMKLTLNARGEGCFTVRAPFMRTSLVLLTPSGARLPVVPTFLTENSDMRAVYTIDMRTVNINYPSVAKGKANIFIGSHVFPLQLTRSPLQMILPAAITAPFLLKIGRYKWSVNPVTGNATPENISRRGGIWLWGGIAAAVIIGILIWILCTRGGKEDKDAGAPPTTSMTSVAERTDSIVRDSVSGKVLRVFRWTEDSTGAEVRKEIPVEQYLREQEELKKKTEEQEEKDGAGAPGPMREEIKDRKEETDKGGAEAQRSHILRPGYKNIKR